MKILLMERSGLVSERLTAMLANLDCVDTVVSVDFAEDAISLRKSMQPEIVVIEACLPDENELRVIARVREVCPMVRVIVLSRDSSEPFRRRWLDAGADCLFDMSTQTDELLDAVRAIASPGSREAGA